jgi:hypothetical protein
MLVVTPMAVLVLVVVVTAMEVVGRVEVGPGEEVVTTTTTGIDPLGGGQGAVIGVILRPLPLVSKNSVLTSGPHLHKLML